MSPPKVFIIILQYNNSADTIRCLKSVKELDYANFEVVVVDNDSKPEHQSNIKDYLSSQWPKAISYKLKAISYNTGYSGGNNVGIKYALENGADYVLILNPDVMVKPDLLKKMVEVAEKNEKIGIVGPTIQECADIASRHIVYGGKIQWLKTELHHNKSYKLQPMNYSLLYIIGSCMLVRRSVFNKIGLFDERYFLYFEDADFSIRAQRAGFRLEILPDVEVSHRVSSSTKSLGPAKLLYYHYRNAHLFNLRNGPLWVKVALPFWSIFVILKQLIKIIFIPQRKEVSRQILSGVIDFYRGRFGQIKEY